MSTVRELAALSAPGVALPAPMYRVLSVPRLAELTEDVDRDQRVDVLSALVGAHVAASPVAVCWLRTGPRRHVNVLVGPAPLAASDAADSDEARLIYPPGTVARRCDGEEVASLLRRIPVWVACGGGFDPLGTRPSDEAARLRGSSLEDCFGHLSHIALAWLVRADPVPPRLAAEMLEELALRLPEQRNLAEASEAARIALERDEAWYRELERSAPLGLWRIHAVAGAATAADALRVATLLCHTGEAHRLPYRLRPLGPGSSDGTGPFVASHELLAAIARPPVTEVPGVRLVRPPPFDVTSEAAGPFRLGEILDGALVPCGRLSVSAETLNRHAFVCGATGSGKSQTVRTLLENLTRVRIPWLVIEPAKAEYGAGMAGRLPDAGVVVIRVGDPALIPGSLNPLRPEPGFPLQSHADMVRALFLAAFDADEPFPQVLSYALTRCYESCGWDLALSRPASSWTSPQPPRYPSLKDLQESAKTVVAEIGYGKEVTDNVRGFVDVRIRSLRAGSPGRFFQGGHPLDMRLLMDSNVVLEMEDVANDQDKAFLIGAVLIRLFEHLRVRWAAEPRQGLRHVTVVEEAHRLLRRTEGGGPTSESIELFANMLAEIRAYGEGLVVAEQIPSKVIPDLIKNTALKVVHRLPAADDRDAVGATMNLSQAQSEYVVTLKPGRAAVFADGMDWPVLSKISYEGEQRERGKPSRRPPVGAARRHSTCGGACQARACTLEEMRLAEELGEALPGLRLWMELGFLCHIVGEPLSGPDEAWLSTVATVDPRRVQCVVSQLAEAACESRYPHLRLFYRPEGLAEHLCGLVAGRVLGREQAACTGRELEWTAGTRRWADIRRALAEDTGDRSQPHPQTSEWALRGIVLPVAGRDAQLAAAKAHPWSWYRHQRDLELGSDGVVTACGLSRSLTALTGSATPESLMAALKQLGLGVTTVVFKRLADYAQAANEM
ncbi:MAG TPA: ATP-binding protein [Streptosporangiaceae bacterium]